nr:MAG: dUTPase [Metapenaeus ensis nimavirus]
MDKPHVCFKKLHEKAIIPRRATIGSVGYDISTIDDNSITTIPPGVCAPVRTGLVVNFKALGGYCGRIVCRSSLAAKNADVVAKVIDSDYRDEIIILVHNHSEEQLELYPGYRFAQLLFLKIETPFVYETQDGTIVSKADKKEKSVFSVSFRKLRDGAVIPRRSEKGLAGYTVSSIDDGHITKIPPGKCVEIATGLSVKFFNRKGHCGFLCPWFGLASKNVTLYPVVLDESFKGEIIVQAHNHSEETLKIGSGERIAQLLFWCALDRKSPQSASEEDVTETLEGEVQIVRGDDTSRVLISSEEAELLSSQSEGEPATLCPKAIRDTYDDDNDNDALPRIGRQSEEEDTIPFPEEKEDDGNDNGDDDDDDDHADGGWQLKVKSPPLTLDNNQRERQRRGGNRNQTKLVRQGAIRESVSISCSHSPSSSSSSSLLMATSHDDTEISTQCDF